MKAKILRNIFMAVGVFVCGCTSTPTRVVTSESSGNLPDVCGTGGSDYKHIYRGDDNLDDSYSGNQAIWRQFNRRYPNGKRKLAVFLDGTNDNAADSSNVRMLYRMTVAQACSGVPIIPYYDKGVGSKGFDFVLGAGFGTGVSLNIRQAYRFLSKVYKKDDEIYVFGFSRGAFTARSLNGFIEFAGLLDGKQDNDDTPVGLQWTTEFERIVKNVFDKYRVHHSGKEDFEDRLKGDLATYEKCEYPNRTFYHDVKVKAIGVFDTVPALGCMLDEEPDNHRLDLYAYTGLHALSLDEQRDKFKLLRFNPINIAKDQQLHEVWFPGVHSDIGGGYAKHFGCNTDKKSKKGYYEGLEATALNWMASNFKAEGLFPDDPVPECVNGILHDEFFASTLINDINRRMPKHSDNIHESVLDRMKKNLYCPNSFREIHQDGHWIYHPKNLQYPISENYKIVRRLSQDTQSKDQLWPDFCTGETYKP